MALRRNTICLLFSIVPRFRPTGQFFFSLSRPATHPAVMRNGLPPFRILQRRSSFFLYFFCLKCRSASKKGRSTSPETGATAGSKSRPSIFSRSKGESSGGGSGAPRLANMGAAAKVLGCLRTNILTILNILGVFSGVVIALILRASREEKWTQREIVYVGFVGNDLVGIK